MHSEKIKSFLLQAEKFLPKRWIFLTLGVGLLAYAQIYFETRNPLSGHLAGAEIWNAVYKLEIVNYDNVWSALPFLFSGFLLWLWFGNFPWKEPAITTEFANTKNINWAYAVPQLVIIIALYIYLIICLAQQRHTHFEPVLWIFTLLWLTYLIWNWDEKSTDLTLDINASDLTTILVLLSIGIAVGSFALTDLPAQIMPDEFPFWQASHAIALGQYDSSFFDVGVFTFPLSTSIFQSCVMRIFGATFWGWRFSSVLAGVAAVIPLYLLTRSWFGQRIAFAAGLMMLVNPYFLSFSRFGYNNSQSLFPVTLAIFLWEKGIRKSSIFYLWLGGLAAGLGYYSFFAAWIAVVAIGLSIFYLRLHKQISQKQVWGFLGILIIAFSLMTAPRITAAINSGKSDALAFKIFQASFMNAFYGHYYYADSELTSVYPLIPVGTDQPLFFNPQIYWELFTRGTIRTFLAIIDPYIATEHFLVSGFAGVITPVFFVIGLALSLKNWKQYRIGLLLLWFFGGMIFLSVLNTFPPRQTHLVALIPVLAILSALGLTSTIEQIVKQDFIQKIISSLILLIIAFFSLQAFFIKLPVIHPANFENHSAWIARRNNVPVTIVYAGPTEKTHLVDSLTYVKIIQGKYLSIPTEVVTRIAKNLTNTPALLFYEGEKEDILREMQEAGFYNYTIYQDANNKVLGYIFTNTAIDLTPDISLYAELIFFLKSPAFILLGIFLGILSIHIMRERYICHAHP